MAGNDAAKMTKVIGVGNAFTFTMPITGEQTKQLLTKHRRAVCVDKESPAQKDVMHRASANVNVFGRVEERCLLALPPSFGFSDLQAGAAAVAVVASCRSLLRCVVLPRRCAQII